jgi:hypothetical protein
MRLRRSVRGSWGWICRWFDGFCLFEETDLPALNRKTCLVLGAGASAYAGFPLGTQLREGIFSFLSNGELLKSSGLLVIENIAPKDLIAEFNSAFLKSNMYSIDSFLARRPEYIEIGKKTIAAILLGKEHDEMLMQDNGREDNWYRYLFNCVAAESWEELDLSNLSVVTFNYDRSFERFLTIAISNSYNKTIVEASEKVKAINIVHVYGSLGAIFLDDPTYLAYDGVVSADKVAIAAAMIQIIREGRDDAPTLQKAKHLLEEADAIGFLGFGYDSTNMQRLDTKNTCKEFMQRQGGFFGRTIISTCIGLKMAEVNAAAYKLDPKLLSVVPSAQLPRGFYNDNCIDTLRDSLLLLS